MKREIVGLIKHPSPCCPGHDNYPNDTYSSNRSKRARSRGKKVEHRYVRRVKRQRLAKQVAKELDESITPTEE